MSIYEYDEERQRRFDREEGREEGRAEGRAEGREEGRAEGREEGRAEGREEGRREVLIDFIRLMLEDNIPISKISRYCHTPEAEIQELIKKLNME